VVSLLSRVTVKVASTPGEPFELGENVRATFALAHSATSTAEASDDIRIRRTRATAVFIEPDVKIQPRRRRRLD
jgi:hypothetical protein